MRLLRLGVLPPTFAQPERRSYLVPGLLALVLIVGVVLWLYKGTKSTISAVLLKTDVLPTTTVFKSDSIVVGPGETSSNLFVVETIRVKNGRNRPIALDDFGLTLTDETGAELAVKALQRQEIPNAELSFPKLKGLVTQPLLTRDAEIAPGESTEGMVVFSLAVPAAIWEKRRSAMLEIDPYHLEAMTIAVPK